MSRPVAQILDMPQLSDTMKIGVLQKWRKNEGDKVSPGEVMAEIETDKAVMDFEAFDEGVLLKRLIVDGTSVPVGTPIAIIGKPGDDIAKLVEEAKARAERRRREGRRARAGEGGARPEGGARSEGGAANGPAAAAAKPAPAPAPMPKRAAAPAPGRPGGPRGDKVLASPLARRMATDLGIDLRNVQGTGPGGRIVERDVKAVAKVGERRRRRDRLARRRRKRRRRRRRACRRPLPCPPRSSPSAAARRVPPAPFRPRTSSSRCR